MTGEDEVRAALQCEAADIGDVTDLLGRVTCPTPRPTGPPWRVVVVVVLVAVLGAAVLQVRRLDRRAAEPGSASTASAVTPAVSLEHAPHLVVTSVEVDPGRQVLYVAYQPSAHVSYEGGAVALLGPGAFDGAAFAASAVRSSVRGHPAYLGSYPYLGRTGSVTTVAWPVSGGRWVLVQNFRGEGDGNDATTNRTAEITVADAVRVQPS